MLPSCHVPVSHEARRASTASSASGSSVPSCGGAQPAGVATILSAAHQSGMVTCASCPPPLSSRQQWRESLRELAQSVRNFSSTLARPLVTTPSLVGSSTSPPR